MGFPLSSILTTHRRLLVLGSAAFFGLFALLTGMLIGLDNDLRELRDGLRSRPASGNIHIIEIDARSLARIDRWPWPRSVHATAIDRLHAAGARAIAFDVDFSATSDPREDAVLAAALARAGHSVILPTLRQQAGAGRSDYVDSVPAKPFMDKAFLAAVNVVPDSDGKVRTMLLGVETKGVPRPSLASMLAEQRAEIGRSFEIDFSIEPGSIPRHSMIDLIEGRVPYATLAGKRIVIGATAVEVWDRYTVPRHGVLPGVVIQALAAETLLTGPIPARASGLWPLLIAVLATACAVRPGARSRRMALFSAAGAIIVALPLLTEAFVATTILIAPGLAAMIVAAALAGLYLGEEARRSTRDSETGLPNLRALAKLAAPKIGGINIVIARIDQYTTIVAGLGPNAAANLVNRVADRLRLAQPERTIYRIDDASLAWIEVRGDESSFDDRIEAIAAIMRAPVDCGRLVNLSLHFGLTTRGDDPQQMVANASLSAAQAARKGTRWQRFTEQDAEAASWQVSLVSELDRAIASGQLWNAYQPKIDIASGRVVGVEALVRWLHAERGPLQPDDFIPLIEEHGRARELTVHVLEQAIEDALSWARAGHPIGVAVNVSATLLAEHGFIESVGEVLRRSGLPTNRLTIEVTETAAMNSPERAIKALESWRALGIDISLDDYGTGQSSLNYLQTLPATELKIDKRFVQTLSTEPRNEIMVRSTIALAHELGMKVVAEGIEDEACLVLLAKMGCDMAQGYLIGRPIPAAEMSEYLAYRNCAAKAA